MSIESAKEFVDRMKHDKDFAGKIMACKDGEARMTLAKAEGFDFTGNELREETAALTDTDIEFISGGGSSKCCVPGMEFIN
jgi:predicted ribosomally synthesized peptide with nif11-like leader